MTGNSSHPERGRGPEILFGYHLGDKIETLDAMPVLRNFVEQWKQKQPLRGVTALLIQHQLSNQGPQILFARQLTKQFRLSLNEIERKALDYCS